MTHLDLLIASGWGDVNRKHVPPEVMAMAQRGERPPNPKEWRKSHTARLSPEEIAKIQREARLKVPPERRREIGRMGGVAKWGDRYKADKIRELLAQCMRPCEIARTLKCAPQSVYYQRKLLGVARKNRRRSDPPRSL